MNANVRDMSEAQPSLPIIDISGLRDGDLATRQHVARQIRLACLDKGFFYISGHGIPEPLIGDIFSQATRFFDLPLDDKMALHKGKSIANRGYEPLMGQLLEEGTAPDLKESYFAGSDLSMSDPRVVAGQFGRGPNQWPEGVPGFQQAIEAYYAVMTQLGGLLYRAIALSLGLREDYFDAFYREPMNMVRMIHYPPQPANPNPNQKGCGAHTDFGGLTILLQDATGGLQVWDQETDGWIAAPPIANTYVVNIGNLISVWTNNVYRSTLHRVINTSGRQRYSVPFFINGDPDYPISCIPTCLASGEAPKFSQTTITEHFGTMYRKTYVA